MALLTKSKYMAGLQCPQYLWISINKKRAIPEPDAVTQFKFDQGHEVGNLAKKWFPEGIDLAEVDFKNNIKKTKEVLGRRLPIFEPGFMEHHLFSRIDILNPIGANEWDIIEVKSSTKVKEENYHDVSFQKLCCERAGLKIRRCFLMHINNEYVRKAEIDPKELLIQEDITDEVISATKGISERIEKMFKIINLRKMPDISIGKECFAPYECPLKKKCWKFLPKSNVFDLYRGGDKSWKLFEDGVVSLGDIPDEFKLTDKQELQRDGKIHIHKEGIKHFLSGLHYPLFYLDFETFSFAVPAFDGVRPYQQIPFQFSLHVVQKDGSMEHFEFLASGAEDPRERFADELKKVIGTEGSIVVFNQSFEISRLKELAEAFPEHKQWINDALTRIIDLIIPFRNFSYYNPKQQGSCSLKDVLPALTGKGYKGLEINNGGDASLSYVNMYFRDGMTEEEIAKIRKNLLEYCSLDTEGMVWIVEALKKLI